MSRENGTTKCSVDTVVVEKEDAVTAPILCDTLNEIERKAGISEWIDERETRDCWVLQEVVSRTLADGGV